MSNPNNCATCDYKKLNANRDKGHCYMFKDAPTDVCMQHTMRHLRSAAEIGKGTEKSTSGIPYVATCVFDNETIVLRGVIPDCAFQEVK